METRYYLGGGPSKGEHKLALHASKGVFDRITGHLDRSERMSAEAKKETEHKKYLRDATKAMTEGWDNSIENLRKKKEQARQQKLAQKADDRVEQYYKVLKWQADERKNYNDQIARKILISRGPQLQLNSCALYSDCLHENAKHIELKNEQKAKEHKNWMEFQKQIVEQDEEFMKNEAIKKCQQRALAEQNQEMLREQKVEKDQRIEEQKKKRIGIEKFDTMRQEVEMKAIKQNKEDDYQAAVKYQNAAIKKSRAIAIKKREASAKRDNEIETVCTLYRNTKEKIAINAKEFQKKEIEKRVELQEAHCKNLIEMKAKKQVEEDKRVARAIAEKEAEEDLKKRKRKEYEERLLMERKRTYQKHLDEMQKKQEVTNESKKWDILNRLKTMEILKKEDEEKEEKRVEKMRNVSLMLDEQVEKNNTRRAEKKVKEAAFKWNDFPEADEKFLQYGAEILERQKAAGKSTYSVEYAITKYKTKYGMVPRKLQKPFASSGEEENLKSKPPKVCPIKSDPETTKKCFCN